MRALRADEADIPGWLDLAAEVEDLFGSPMSADPTFERILERHVADGTGFVVRESPATPGAAVIGAAMWLPQRRRIGWLAVAERYRRTGVGSCLLDAIIEVAGPGPISVVSFGSDVSAGTPARLFYEAHGFERVGPAQGEPATSSRDLFVRP